MVKKCVTICLFLKIGTDGAGELNQAGIDHYNNLINALLAKGIVYLCLQKTNLIYVFIYIEAFFIVL